MKTIDM